MKGSWWTRRMSGGGDGGTSGTFGTGGTAAGGSGKAGTRQSTSGGGKASGAVGQDPEQRGRALSAERTRLIADRDRLVREQQEVNRAAGFLEIPEQLRQLQKQINQLNRELQAVNAEQAQLALTPEQKEVRRLKENARARGDDYLRTGLKYGFGSEQARRAGARWEDAKQEKMDAGVHPTLRFANQVNAASSGLVGNFSQAAATAAGVLAEYGAPEDTAKWLYRAGQAAQAKSDEMTAEEARSDAASRYGPGKAGNAAMDATRLVTDVAMRLPFDMAVPGLGRALDAVEGFGAGARMAHQAGASSTEETLYGLGSLGLSVLAGKVGGELSAVYGKQFAGAFLNDALAKSGKSSVWRKGIPLVLDALGAGGAAVTTALLDPVLQSVYDQGDAMSYYFGTPEGRSAALQRAGEDTLGRLFFALSGRTVSALGREEPGGRIEDAVARDLQAGVRETDGVVQTETAVPGGRVTVRQEPDGYAARVVDADGQVQREQRGLLTQQAAVQAAAEAGTDWVRRQPETQRIAAGLEAAAAETRGTDGPERAPGGAGGGRGAAAVEAEPARALEPAREPEAALSERSDAETERRTAAGERPEQPDAAARLEEAETLLLKAGFDDPYGTESRSMSAEEAARLEEAKRIVNEAARERQLQEEAAMLRGGKEAEPVDAAKSAGKGEMENVGGVEPKTEATEPTVERQFDWKQAGMTAEEYMRIAKSANAMYDIGSEAENVRAYLRDQPLRERIQSGEMVTQLEMGQFRKHVPGTNEYKQYVDTMHRKGWHGPSRLSISPEEVQQLIDQYKGTGNLIWRKGRWTETEEITMQTTVVGTVVDNKTGNEAESAVFKIHYGSRGTHIVPDYPSKKGRKGQR